MKGFQSLLFNDDVRGKQGAGTEAVSHIGSSEEACDTRCVGGGRGWSFPVLSNYFKELNQTHCWPHVNQRGS